MHPILFELGPLAIPTYGTIMVIAFLSAAFLLKKEAQKSGLPGEKIIDLAVVTLLSGLIGAKLLLIAIDLPTYIQNPKQLLSTIRAAGVLYGGLIAGAGAAIWFIRKHKLPFWDSLDAMAPFAALGIGIGRFGCLAAGCCYGFEYDGWGAIHFPAHPYCEAPADIGLFPVQLVSVVNGLVLFGILLWQYRRRAFSGQTLLLFFMLYALARGLIEFIRGDTLRGVWLGFISTSQIIAIAVFILASCFYWHRRKARH